MRDETSSVFKPSFSFTEMRGPRDHLEHLHRGYQLMNVLFSLIQMVTHSAFNENLLMKNIYSKNSLFKKHSLFNKYVFHPGYQKNNQNCHILNLLSVHELRSIGRRTSDRSERVIAANGRLLKLRKLNSERYHNRSPGWTTSPQRLLNA